MQRSRRRCNGTAMGSIIIDLRPGLGIGPFSLGMPISEAVAQIEQQPNIYDVVHVKCYDEERAKAQDEYRQNRLEFRQFLEACSFIKLFKLKHYIAAVL